jgi:predicted metalloprotease with PDZ domain
MSRRKRFVAAMLTAFIAGTSCAIPAMAEKPTPMASGQTNKGITANRPAINGSYAVHYYISSENIAGRFSGLTIRLDLDVESGSTQTLDLPEGLSSHLTLSGFAIEGGSWIGGAVPQDDKMSLKASSSHVTVTYHLVSDGSEELSGDSQHMGIHANWFSMRGDESLITPEGYRRTSVVVDIAASPDWMVTSSLEGPVPLSQIGDSVFLGGIDYHVLTRRVDGANFRLAYPSALSGTAESLLDAAATIMTTERRFWGTPARPVYIGLVELRDDADFSGRGLQGGFSLYLGGTVERKSWLRLIAHENLHNWISRRIGGFPTTNSNLEAWLNEGFTEAYTAQLLRSSGLWNEQDFIDDWNTSLARYGTSPVKTAPNSRILVDRQRDYDVNKLPYDRGRILAVILDEKFRRKTRGRVGLADVLRAQILEAERNEKIGHPVSADQLFPQVARRLTGLDLTDDLASFIDQGAPLALGPDTLGSCIKVNLVTQPVFDRGFDLHATFKAHGVLTGLESGGPAEKAGLHEGEKLRIDETPTNDSRVTLRYRVDDGNGLSHTVSYRPIGVGNISFQQVSKNSNHPANCWLNVSLESQSASPSHSKHVH